ncbi:hypothetical protein E8E12_008145 [Didymella heteroderae]|uniref:Uncharacterized protein n=1 Tax=Didymella heteroderae TaxID=1769908 RepID=A0A9P5C194_9PLEO|nr:hypothetical protein E8E12_008145 [Didymella heteroderae]
MSNSHRRFHRRAPQAEGTGANIKTVNVEVVATVDTAGNVVAQTTVTQPDPIVPTEASQVLPVTNAGDVSAPIAAVESAVPTAPAAAADAAASTPEVPSIASLPSETQLAVPSTPTEPSQASVPTVSAEPTIATVAALPSVPSVPAVPSVSLPSVPSVPAFPSDLTVPAYPYASSVGAVAAEAVDGSSASNATASSEPSVVAALTVAAASSSTTSSIFASTSSVASSILASSPTLLSTMRGFTYSSPSVVSVASATAISSRIAAGSPQIESSPSTTASSNRATPTESLDAAGSSSFYGSGGQGWNGGSGSATAAAPAGTNAAAAGDSDSTTPTPLDTPQVVGSVVGSLAGAALILAIILMLLRRHKRRQGGALQLTDSHPTDNEQQSMRQVQAPPRLARASLVPSAFLNRFSGLSKSTADTSSPTERSFQRVSGRKLPSAFSEGMTSDQFSRSGHMSGMTESSFYTDDHGTYGGPGLNKEYGGGFGKETGESPFAGGAGSMNFRPSPARTPIIHHPNENPFDDTNQALSPPMSPNPFSSPADLSPRAALGRSLHSADGSRSSRFTENV